MRKKILFITSLTIALLASATFADAPKSWSFYGLDYQLSIKNDSDQTKRLTVKSEAPLIVQGDIAVIPNMVGLVCDPKKEYIRLIKGGESFTCSVPAHQTAELKMMWKKGPNYGAKGTYQLS